MTAPRPRGRRLWAQRLVAAIIGAAAAGGAMPAAAGDGPTETPSILVMPFEAAGSEPSLAWLPEAVAIRLADELEARGAGAFTRRERRLVHAALGVRPSAELSRPSALNVARLLGARWVIVGSVGLEAAVVVIRARTLPVEEVSADEELVERGPLGDLLQVVARLARRIAAERAAPAATSGAATVALDAFELYVKGLLAVAPRARVEFLRSAVQRAPADHRLRIALWEAEMVAGEPEQALETAWSVPDDALEGRHAQLLASRSLIELGRLDEAEKSLRELLDLGADASVWAHLGLVQLTRGGRPDSGRLTYFFHQAVVQDPDDHDALFNLGYAYWLEEEPGASAYWLKESLRLNPGDAEARFLLGTVLERQDATGRAAVEIALAGMLAEVAGWVSRFASWPPSPDPGALIRTDWLTPREHRVAGRLRQNVRRERRRWSRLHLERGQVASDGARDQEALDELGRAIRLQPDQAEAHLLVARAHLRADRASAAVTAGVLSAWLGETVAVRLVLAEAHMRLGQTAAARREATRALELDPGAPGATRLLERLARDGSR